MADLDDFPMSTYTYIRSHPAALMAERTVIHIAAKLVNSGAELTGLTYPGTRWPDALPFFTVLARFMRGFGVGWAGKMVFALAGLLVKTKLRPGPLLVGLRRAAISSEVVGYGMATGSFLALFEATMRLSKQLKSKTLSPTARVWLSSLVGSLSVFFLPKGSRQVVSIFFLVRALEVTAKGAAKDGHIPSIKHGDVLVMAIASAQVIWAWLHFRPSLDPSYLKFLDHQGGRHIIPQTMVANNLKTGTSAVFDAGKALNKLNKFRGKLGFRPLDRSLDVNRLHCELLHPDTSYCTLDGVKFFGKGLQRAVWVYLPIFLIPLLFRTNLLRRRPFKALSVAFMGIARSSIFLSLYCTLCWSTSCLLYKLGVRNQIIVAMAGFVGGLTVAIEKKGRRIELGLYVLQQAIPSFYQLLRSKRIVPHIPNFPVILYAISLGAIMQAYLLREKLLRPSYVSLLDFLFDRSALIERSDSTPSPLDTPEPLPRNKQE